jgi:hypothetical protein
LRISVTTVTSTTQWDDLPANLKATVALDQQKVADHIGLSGVVVMHRRNLSLRV